MPRSRDRKAPMRQMMLRLATLGVAGLALAGCSTLRPTQKAFAPDEYNQRHPIKISIGQLRLYFRV